ncbi:O-fucosyltransferase family protein [Zea mays]|uniref:O-fucosyltransferase family protein n=1 Tax=Zea mays TaxID=4577 RepID=A0A1D6GU41_MAIZE|nr:O-fucosyltransferase family protein [Zea mays]
MAELRHATAATRATSSPSKRDAEAASASSPLVASPRVDGGKDGLRPQPRWSLPPPLPLPPRARGPQVRQRDSLWENPHAAATWWKPCAERQSHEVSGKYKIRVFWLKQLSTRHSLEKLWFNPDNNQFDLYFADLVSENETSGFIFIHAEGGLNQQRIAVCMCLSQFCPLSSCLICNAVAIAKIMNATLILPVLKQDQIWKDQTKFEDIFDVDHFINYLKEDVRIVRDIPDWFTEKDELFTSIKLVSSFSAIHCVLTVTY